MIAVDWKKLLKEYADLADDFQRLPYHVAKKHLLASMRKSIRDAKGLQLLRKNTPPTSTRRGRRKAGQKRSTGELRRSVMIKAKWIGRNRDGFAVAGLGYKFNRDNRKAIWMEYGTTLMAGRKMMQQTFEQIRGLVANNLSRNLAASLEKAAAERDSGKNKGYGG